MIARWEAGAVTPSFETVRRVVRACGLEVSISVTKLDDSNVAIIDDHLRMTPAQRFAELMARTKFRERRELAVATREH